MQRDISIIIVNWNTRLLLMRCLESLPPACGDSDYETWVVDNASADGSADWIREHCPQVNLVASAENIGFAAANNLAAAQTRGRYLLLLNPDTEAKPASIASLVTYADAHPEIGALGPRLLNSDGSTQRSCWHGYPGLTMAIADALYLWKLPWAPRAWTAEYRPHELGAPRAVDHLLGACILIRRTAWDRVGPLDANYFLGSEETDWCYRASRAGWKIVYHPEFQVIHYGQRSIRQQPTRTLPHMYSSYCRFYRRHRRSQLGMFLLLGIFACGAIIRIGLWSVRAINGRDVTARQQTRGMIEGYWQVLRHLPRELRENPTAMGSSPKLQTTRALVEILFLSQIVPYPPDSGPKAKTFHVLRYLAECGHRVTLVTFAREEEQAHLDGLRPFCAEIHTVPLRRSRLADALALAASVASGRPFLVERDDKREMHNLVRRLIHAQHFDIVHADQLTMAQYALHIHSSQFAIRNSPALVFDAHNAVWQIVERSQQTARFLVRPFLAHEARRLKKYEGELCRAMDAVLAVSQVDQRALVDAGADPQKITIIPIAIDCASLPRVRCAERTADILSVSTLFYPPNADGVRWFLREVFPLIRRAVPEATCTIVGLRPPDDIAANAARDPEHIRVTGYIADLSPYLSRARVMIVPVRVGSGMRVRILEALARGIPVVTTTTGVEGIEAVHGEHLLVADDPRDFADAVAQVLQGANLRDRLAENGRGLVERKYDWHVVLPRLESVYQTLVQK